MVKVLPTLTAPWRIEQWCMICRHLVPGRLVSLVPRKKDSYSVLSRTTVLHVLLQLQYGRELHMYIYIYLYETYHNLPGEVVSTSRHPQADCRFLERSRGFPDRGHAAPFRRLKGRDVKHGSKTYASPVDPYGLLGSCTLGPRARSRPSKATFPALS
jgi:hypothetical protein